MHERYARPGRNRAANRIYPVCLGLFLFKIHSRNFAMWRAPFAGHSGSSNGLRHSWSWRNWLRMDHYNKLLLFLSGMRLAPHILLMLFSSNREMIWADLDRWSEALHLPKPSHDSIGRIFFFVRIMSFFPEYRNVFYMRAARYGPLFKILCRPIADLFIRADSIGPGLFVQHGYGTSVWAATIGKNFWVNQLVTVGYTNETDHPTIGDNVTINTGATVVGNVCIGNNSKVAANSLVIDNVPPGATVIGVPAKIVWRG